MRSYEEYITDQTIIAKVLKSLTPKLSHVVAISEESKGLSIFSIFSFNELIGFLHADEANMCRSIEKKKGKAFQVKGESSNKKDKPTARWCKDGFHGRCHGHGKGWNKGQYYEQYKQR